MSACELTEKIRALGGKSDSYDSVEKAVFAAVQNAGTNGVCAALGTLYFSADVRSAVQKLPD